MTKHPINSARLAPYLPAPGTVTVFSATWCGHCTQLKRMLKAESIPYREVLIEEDAEAEAIASDANADSWVIPTVITEVGEILVHPGISGVRQAFARVERPEQD